MPSRFVPPTIRLADHTYVLPPERIAAHPLPQRDESKLLVYRANTQSIEHRMFRDLPALLPERSLLVVNRTRVIAARIHLVKPTGGVVELLLTDPLHPLRDPAVVLASHEPSVWRGLIGGRNVQPGMVLTEPHCDLRVTVIERQGTEAAVELQWDRDISLSHVLSEVGHLPLPPYLHREANEDDATRYQTVYAVEEGSVAAPTAGLHFTEDVLTALEQRGIERVDCTLHVGLGTFRPVEAEKIEDHVMHAERFGITRVALERMHQHLLQDQSWVTVVGTTSLRTMESVYAFGSKILRDGIDANPTADVDQWDAFDVSLNGFSRSDVIASVLSWLDYHGVDEVWGETQLMIAPGCRIAMADALVTNFHQPGNTLLLLVAGFCGGDHWRDVYEAALKNDYRFLSYGDSSLLIRGTW